MMMDLRTSFPLWAPLGALSDRASTQVRVIVGIVYKSAIGAALKIKEEKSQHIRDKHVVNVHKFLACLLLMDRCD